MLNSFEKQVREKMDELRFVPTAPVWTNIEKQIRPKKDRRRFFIWVPLLLLVSGAGIWWLYFRHQSSPVTTIANKMNVGEDRVIKKDEQSPIVTDHSAVEKRNLIKPSIVDRQVELVSIKRNYIRNNNLFVLVKPSPVNSKRQKISIADLELGSTKKTFALAKPNELEKSDDAVIENNSKISVANKIDISHQSNASKDSLAKNKIAAAKIDTGNVKNEATKPKANKLSKWQWGVITSAGFSNSVKDFVSFSLDKSADAMMVNNGPGSTIQPGNKPPSSVKDNLSFAIGVLAKRKINERISISAGLQYNYYSTKITVGQMRQDSAIYGVNLMQTVNRYYMNTGNSFNNYRNNYHFVSMPVVVEWKMLKKLPLSLQTGFSIQQLVSTNSLLYDARNNVYYTDKSLFNKTQLFYNLGFAYAFFNKAKTSLLLGPQLQYGLSRLDKNNDGKHLLSIGLSAQFLFSKK